MTFVLIQLSLVLLEILDFFIFYAEIRISQGQLAMDRSRTLARWLSHTQNYIGK